MGTPGDSFRKPKRSSLEIKIRGSLSYGCYLKVMRVNEMTKRAYVRKKIDRNGPRRESWGTLEMPAEGPKAMKPCQKQHSERWEKN